MTPEQMRADAATAEARARQLERDADTEWANAARLNAVADLTEERVRIQPERDEAQAALTNAQADLDAAEKSLAEAQAQRGEAEQVLHGARLAAAQAEADRVPMAERLTARIAVTVAENLVTEVMPPISSAEEKVRHATDMLRYAQRQLEEIDERIADVDQKINGGDPASHSRSAAEQRLRRDWMDQLLGQGQPGVRPFGDAEWDIVAQWARACMLSIPPSVTLAANGHQLSGACGAP
jgi:hypothetical protein